MEPELKAYLDNISSHLLAGMAAMETRLGERIESVETRLREHIETVETRLREHTETIETKLLTEFWNWAKTAEARFRQARTAVGAFEDRVEAIEDRVSELERRRAV